MGCFKGGDCVEEDGNVLRGREGGGRAGSCAEFEVDDAVEEEGLEDGSGGVAEGVFVCEEGVDVFAEEGEEAVDRYISEFCC